MQFFCIAGYKMLRAVTLTQTVNVLYSQNHDIKEAKRVGRAPELVIILCGFVTSDPFHITTTYSLNFKVKIIIKAFKIASKC